MTLLENETLQGMVDYSFGDQSGVLGGVPNAYMKKANIDNTEFIEKVWNFRGKIMTLFIDNIRLYRRQIDFSDWLHMKPIASMDRQWLNQFVDEDLLELCSNFPEVYFVIFTAFEDTPLDEHIWEAIPANVISINAANGVVFGGKVHPFPHGIERKMYEGYDHHEILTEMIEDDTKPTKLMLVCHRDDTGDRKHLKELLKWATVTSLPYEEYLHAIKDHKFVLCPSGNGIGSSRNWETLYMRRVPVMEDHPYKRQLFKGLPVLFVKNYDELTKELLSANEHLYQEALNLDMEKLDLKQWFTTVSLIAEKKIF